MEINPLVASMNGEVHLGCNKSNASSRASVKPHVDPFVDPHEGEAHTGDVKAEDTTSLLSDIPSVGSGGRYSSQSSLPQTFAMMVIARSGDTSPGYYDQGESVSVESHEAPSSRSTQSTSLTGTGVTSSSTDYSSISSPTSPRTTSIIGATITPNIPMCRSDSWWSRFSRTSFLDRHSSSDVSNRNGVNGGLADFRDPNPAPQLGQLGAIQESTYPSRQSSLDRGFESSRCFSQRGWSKQSRPTKVRFCGRSINKIIDKDGQFGADRGDRRENGGSATCAVTHITGNLFTGCHIRRPRRLTQMGSQQF
ncbi:hypothetical protein JB92DRAFT_3099960 [Gautieria morchelliformis]|nr:hypothetical protein JB92DRAFT_3099960 [Gautieria morchelliformis]